MVLFKEDNKAVTPGKRRLRLFFRVVLVSVFLFCFSLFALSMLGGSHESLRNGAEQYMSGVTGMKADVGTFNGMHFYPDIRLDMADVSFYEGDSAEPSAKIGTFLFSANFWDMILSGTRMEVLKVTNISIRENLIAAGAVFVDRMALDESGYNGKPALVIEGTYGGGILQIYLGLAAEKRAHDRIFFTRPPETPFMVRLDSLRMEGMFSEEEGGGMHLDFSMIGMPDDIGTGRSVIKYDEGGFHADTVWYDMTPESEKALNCLLMSLKPNAVIEESCKK